MVSRLAKPGPATALVWAAILVHSSTVAADEGPAEPVGLSPPSSRAACRVAYAGADRPEAVHSRLFILSGQSNMAAMDETVVLIPSLVSAFPNDDLVFVKDSQSGQSIRRWYEDWKPVGDWPTVGTKRPGNNDLYRRLMGKVAEASAGREFESVTFMWMQGEADAKRGQSANYADSLAGLIQQLRRDLGREDVGMVVGRISDHLCGNPDWDRVRRAQVEVAEADPLAAWIDTDEWNGANNALHYLGAGKDALAAAFAEKAIQLLTPETATTH